MKRLLPCLCIAAATLSATSAARAQSDPRVGTWVLNVAKSKYTPGPPPAAEVRRYAPASQAHALATSIESMDVAGHRVTLQYTAGDDGKDYPMTGVPFADAVAIHRKGATTFEVDTKKNGKIIGTTQGEISKDGRVLTLTSKTRTAAGQAVTNIAVYDKKQ